MKLKLIQPNGRMDFIEVHEQIMMYLHDLLCSPLPIMKAFHQNLGEFIRKKEAEGIVDRVTSFDLLPDFMTTEDIADYCGVRKETIHNWKSKGILNVVPRKKGNRNVFPKSEVAKWWTEYQKQ